MSTVTAAQVIPWEEPVLFGIALEWSDGTQSMAPIGFHEHAQRAADEAIGKTEEWVHQQVEEALMARLDGPHSAGPKGSG